MAELTSKEQQLVEKYKQLKRPDYYSANSQQYVGISEELEQFIILMPPEARQKTINWINKNTEYSQRNTVRNELLDECLEFDQMNAQSQLDETEVALKDYEQFLDSFYSGMFPVQEGEKPKQVRFASVLEVKQIKDDLSFSVQETQSLQGRAQHLKVLTNVLDLEKDRTRQSKERRLETSSWAGPLSAYTNGNK